VAQSIVRGGFGEGAGLLAARDGAENEGGPVFRDAVVGGAPGGAMRASLAAKAASSAGRSAVLRFSS